MCCDKMEEEISHLLNYSAIQKNTSNKLKYKYVTAIKYYL